MRERPERSLLPWAEARLAKLSLDDWLRVSCRGELVWVNLARIVDDGTIDESQAVAIMLENDLAYQINRLADDVQKFEAVDVTLEPRRIWEKIGEWTPLFELHRKAFEVYHASGKGGVR